MKKQYITPNSDLQVIQQTNGICTVSALQMGGSGDATKGRAPKREPF